MSAKASVDAAHASTRAARASERSAQQVTKSARASEVSARAAVSSSIAQGHMDEWGRCVKKDGRKVGMGGGVTGGPARGYVSGVGGGERGRVGRVGGGNGYGRAW